ncbi:hypothetical protein ABPG72_000506 [Tetrahymena utriculariae]
MAHQQEQFGFIKKSESQEIQNYLSGILLNTEGIDFSNTISGLSQNQKLEEIQLRQETLIQSNLDNTIKKNVKANITKLKQQLGINIKDQCILNVSQNQFLLIINKESSNQIQIDLKDSNQLSQIPLAINKTQSIYPIQLDRSQQTYQVPTLLNQTVKKETNEINQRIKFNETQNQEDQIQVEDPYIQIELYGQSKGNLDSYVHQRNEQFTYKEIQKPQQLDITSNQLKRENQNTEECFQDRYQESIQIIHETTQQNTLDNIKSQLNTFKKQESNQRKQQCQIDTSESQYVLILEDIGSNIIKCQLTKRNSFKNQGNAEIEIISQNLNGSQVAQKPSEELKRLFISPNSNLKNQFKSGYERNKNQLEEKGESQDMNQLQESKIDNIQSENCEQQQTDAFINQNEMLLVMEEFNQCNKNKDLNKHFIQNQQEIFQKLKQFQYQLCELRYSQEFEDVFYGYQKLDDNKKSNFVFKILYNTSKSDTYDLQQDQIQSYQISEFEKGFRYSQEAIYMEQE